ncbi:DUF2637 domain-containing protein [Streptomyces sp. SD15]
MSTDTEPQGELRGAGASIWMRGSGLSALWSWQGARRTPRTFIGGSSRAGRSGQRQRVASLWPLSVDGLLLLATVGLLKPAAPCTPRARGAVWSAFLLGIAVSLAANVAAAPTLEWKQVLVAGWPSAALLAHSPAGRLPDTADQED